MQSIEPPSPKFSKQEKLRGHPRLSRSKADVVVSISETKEGARNFSACFQSEAIEPLYTVGVWSLNESQNAFLSQYFSEWLGEHTIKESILDDTPMPDHHLLTPARLEQDMVDLLPTKAQGPVKLIDASFVNVQTK